MTLESSVKKSDFATGIGAGEVVQGLFGDGQGLEKSGGTTRWSKLKSEDPG